MKQTDPERIVEAVLLQPAHHALVAQSIREVVEVDVAGAHQRVTDVQRTVGGESVVVAVDPAAKTIGVLGVVVARALDLLIDADLAIASERGKDAPDSEGSVLIEIDDFIIANSTMMGMDLVAAEFSEAVLELKMKGKKAEIERGRFESELVDLTIDGHVNMSASAIDRWRLRLELSFTLGESLDSMASMVPSLKRARGEDGTYHMLCTGTWGNPVCREDRSKVRGERPQRRGRGMDAAGPDEERPSTSSRRKKRRSEDAEKRREDRRRRLEDRRSRLREERPEELEEEGFDNGPDIELDREFDRPGPRRPMPFGPGEDLDLPPQREFEDDFVPPDFDEGGLPLDDQSDEGEYIDD